MTNTDWTAIATRYRDLVDSGVDLGKRPLDETVLVWILRALEVLTLAEAERMVVIQKQEDHAEFERNIHRNLCGPQNPEATP